MPWLGMRRGWRRRRRPYRRPWGPPPGYGPGYGSPPPWYNPMGSGTGFPYPPLTMPYPGPLPYNYPQSALAAWAGVKGFPYYYPPPPPPPGVLARGQQLWPGGPYVGSQEAAVGSLGIETYSSGRIVLGQIPGITAPILPQTRRRYGPTDASLIGYRSGASDYDLLSYGYDATGRVMKLRTITGSVGSGHLYSSSDVGFITDVVVR